MSTQQNTAMVHHTAADLVKTRMTTMLKSLGGGPKAAEKFREAAMGLALSPGLAGCTPESAIVQI